MQLMPPIRCARLANELGKRHSRGMTLLASCTCTIGTVEGKKWRRDNLNPRRLENAVDVLTQSGRPGCRSQNREPRVIDLGQIDMSVRQA